MRETTGQVTSRTVGYKRISSILPMHPKRFCIWSLVACGAMFVTWTTLVDIIKNRWIFTHSLTHTLSCLNFFLSLFHSLSFHWKPQIQFLERSIVEIEWWTGNIKRNDSPPGNVPTIRIKFYCILRFSHSFSSLHIRLSCTPMYAISKTRKWSFGQRSCNESYNLTCDHIDFMCCQMPALTAVGSKLYTTATLSVELEPWNFLWMKRRPGLETD